MDPNAKIAEDASELLRSLYNILEPSEFAEKVAAAAIMVELSPVLNIVNLADWSSPNEY